MPEEIEAVHTVLTEIELTMRERLNDLGMYLPHLLIASDPAGNTLILGTMDPIIVKHVCNDLYEHADRELRRNREGNTVGNASGAMDAGPGLKERVLAFIESEITNRTEVLEGIDAAWFRFRVRGHDGTQAQRLEYEKRLQTAKELATLLRGDT